MSFPRDRLNLGERLRGKSTDEIIQEMRDSMDERKKKFFNKTPQSWFSSSASSSRRFPFGDDSRQNLDFHLDRLAEEHPDLAAPLRSFKEEKTSKKKRKGSGREGPDKQATGDWDSNLGTGDQVRSDTDQEGCSKTDQQGSSKSEQQGSSKTDQQSSPGTGGQRSSFATGDQCKCGGVEREERGLGDKLRYTVPDMRRQQEEEQERVSRSQSAPPSQQTQGQDNQTNSQSGPTSREPIVRHIPIYVEGRDETIIPKDFVDAPFPSEKRNVSREASPVPPARRSAQEQPTSVHVEHPNHGKHTSSVHINHSGSQEQQPQFGYQPQQQGFQQPQHGFQQPQPQYGHQQQPHPQQQPQPQFGHQPQQQPQQPPQPQPPQKPQPKPILTPLEKVQAVQDEVQGLSERVGQYGGGSRQDKEYVYLDEMLTRNLLKLDNIETEGREDVRAARKEAIKQIQRCISHLEGKAPTNSSNKDSVGALAANSSSGDLNSKTAEESTTETSGEDKNGSAVHVTNL